MDFSFNEAEQAVKELADRLCADFSTPERLHTLEAEAGEAGAFDRELWRALGEADLLGLGVPERFGGSEAGFLAVCLVIEAMGRHAAAVPLVETLVYAADTIEHFGTFDQREGLLSMVVRGELVLTAALVEQVDELVVASGDRPATVALEQPGGGWRLEGVKACVPAGMLADHILVPALRRDYLGRDLTPAVFVVDVTAPGVSRRPLAGAARTEALVELAGVALAAADIVGGPGSDASALLGHLRQHATVALCVAQAGACAAAVDLMAEYTKTREQFGKPIASFQAVGQRAADAYVDAQAVKLTAWQAAWRLSRGLPAAAEVATAKYWAAEAGQRVVHAATHLHGGVGVDRTYPLHRYFLLTEQMELTLGNATESLLALGSLLADEPV